MRLIPPRYDKPFVKRGKNDRDNAEAINEAASRPAMRFVPVKSAAHQAGTLILKARDPLVRQRTQLINAMREHTREFGVIAATGARKVERRPRKVAAVALANKMARVAWAMMTSGEAYRAARSIPVVG